MAGPRSSKVNIHRCRSSRKSKRQLHCKPAGNTCTCRRTCTLSFERHVRVAGCVDAALRMSRPIVSYVVSILLARSHQHLKGGQNTPCDVQVVPADVGPGALQARLPRKRAAFSIKNSRSKRRTGMLDARVCVSKEPELLSRAASP